MTRSQRGKQAKNPSHWPTERPVIVEAGRTFVLRFGPPLAFLISVAAVVVLTFAALRGLGCPPRDAARIVSKLASAAGAVVTRNR